MLENPRKILGFFVLDGAIPEMIILEEEVPRLSQLT